MHKALIHPVAIYGSESWKTTESYLERLHFFEQRILRTTIRFIKISDDHLTTAMTLVFECLLFVEYLSMVHDVILPLDSKFYSKFSVPCDAALNFPLPMWLSDESFASNNSFLILVKAQRFVLLLLCVDASVVVV
jgi:hypothetical protein